MTLEPISVSVGGTFPVRLRATPTTGYVWVVDALPESFELLGSDFEKPPGETQPGGHVVQAFRFRALKEGEYTINFVLKRQWESHALDACAVNVSVKVDMSE